MKIILLASMLSVAVFAGSAIAQEKQHVAYKITTETTKYTQDHPLNVEEPGHNHLVRVWEAHTVFSNSVPGPVINGVKETEVWVRGWGDNKDGNGSFAYYGVLMMENGDKIFTKATGVVESTGAYMGIGQFTGGTGKFAGIQGNFTENGMTNIKVGAAAQGDIEYWFAK